MGILAIGICVFILADLGSGTSMPYYSTNAGFMNPGFAMTPNLYSQYNYALSNPYLFAIPPGVVPGPPGAVPGPPGAVPIPPGTTVPVPPGTTVPVPPGTGIPVPPPMPPPMPMPPPGGISGGFDSILSLVFLLFFLQMITSLLL